MEGFYMNKTASKEWLTKAWHNLSTARLLYEVNHYTDIIAVEIHYAVEKSLKSFLAYRNQKIPKTHNLLEIYTYIDDFIQFENDELLLLKDISSYHIEEAYPVFNRPLPPKEEIKEVLEFSEKIFEDVCNIFDIQKDELK
jgi:HEPN domain-containing protein